MISWFNKKLNNKVGQPPGSVITSFTEEQSDTKVSYFSYNKEEFIEDTIELNDIPAKFKSDNIDWLTITGFKSIEKIIEIGERANIHKMLLEDSINVDHIPKYEEDDNYLVFMLKSFFINENSELNQCHNCILLGDQLVIHLQEKENNILTEKIGRIRQSKGRARFKKADYLFFVIIDAFVDTHYNYLESLRENLLEIEDKLLSQKNLNCTEETHSANKKLTYIRKSLFPLKDAVNQLLKDEPESILQDNLIYFKDLKDHVNELIEYYNSFSDMIKSLHSLNDSNINQSMNSTMKMLTIIATIFIPLTFLAGIYGMNFKFMPELDWEYGYPGLLLIMLVVGLVMFIFMKRKKWF